MSARGQMRVFLGVAIVITAIVTLRNKPGIMWLQIIAGIALLALGIYTVWAKSNTEEPSK